MNLEALLTHPDGFGLAATPCQRAICRVMTGEPLAELAADPSVIAMLGGQAAVLTLPGIAPDMTVLGAAVRCAKSTIVAAKALRAAYLGDCSGLAPGEVPRVTIVSVDLDKAQETLSKIIGAVQGSPTLRQLMIGQPKTDSITIRNISGRPVQIKMAAGSVAGRTLVSRWLLGIIFDEAPRMQGQEDGAINLEDALSAIVARMRPGAQIDLVGSLWAPKGKVFELITHRHGSPGKDVIVMVATGPMLRPDLYTPEYCERIRLADDRAYESDVMSRFADPETALLPSIEVTAANRGDTYLGPTLGQNYVAVIDPATRGNGWTLVVLGTRAAGGFEVNLAREWLGSRARPLKGSEVLPEIGEAIAPFGIDCVYTDQAGYDHLTDIAELVAAPFELRLLNRDDDIAGKRLPMLLTERRLSLPDIKQLRQDLIAIKRRPKQSGGSQILLPKTADGRHCDFGAAVLLGMQVLPEHANLTPAHVPDDEELACARLRNQRSRGTMNNAALRLMGV